MLKPGATFGFWKSLLNLLTKKLQAHHSILVLIGGVLVISIVWTPPDEPNFTLCGFKNLTGLPCPGCGLTRSFCAIGKGDIYKAMHFNALGPALYLLAAYFWIAALLRLLNRPLLLEKGKALIYSKYFLPLLITSMLAFWIIRILFLIAQK
ncbi:MAG: DUF2752 domain-containing protein [Acidobacteriota bacterium]|nr:DUF2752 domain-containing protein [Blastocatellia bacterium]MDW8412107.1 DUF2752 domain-containing protein [Acidobacteriota bacterium]